MDQIIISSIIFSTWAFTASIFLGNIFRWINNFIRNVLTPIKLITSMVNLYMHKVFFLFLIYVVNNAMTYTNILNVMVINLIIHSIGMFDITNLTARNAKLTLKTIWFKTGHMVLASYMFFAQFYGFNDINYQNYQIEPLLVYFHSINTVNIIYLYNRFMFKRQMDRKRIFWLIQFAMLIYLTFQGNGFLYGIFMGFIVPNIIY